MKYDVIIIGAGPAGVTAAVYLKRANFNILVLEAKNVGGQVGVAGVIENYPGFVSIPGQDLAEKFKEQLLALDVPFINNRVLSVEKVKDTFKVKTGMEEYEARAVIAAVGAKPRALGVANEEELVGSGVSYCVYCDGALYRDCDVAVVGGGYSATEAALYLSKIAKKVHLLNAANTLTVEAVTMDAIRAAKNINVVNNAKVIGFEKDQDGLLASVSYNVGNITNKLDIFGAFVYIGRVPETEFIKNEEILDKGKYIITDFKLQSSVPGLFAVGDCRLSDTKQITTAVADGTNASFAVTEYLSKNK